jgi:hypothetical protein
MLTTSAFPTGVNGDDTTAGGWMATFRRLQQQAELHAQQQLQQQQVKADVDAAVVISDDRQCAVGSGEFASGDGQKQVSTDAYN